MEALFALICITSAGAWIWFRHSFFSVPFVIFLSLWVQDFYPLSHFPMYSDPDESENYFYLATPQDGAESNPKPLPVRSLTGVTAPKVKKIFKAWADELAREQDKSRNDLTEEERVKIGRDVLDFLKQQAEKRGRGDQLPAELALVEVWIVYDTATREITETPTVVATLR